jgi:hypothetical protein
MPTAPSEQNRLRRAWNSEHSLLTSSNQVGIMTSDIFIGLVNRRPFQSIVNLTFAFVIVKPQVVSHFSDSFCRRFAEENAVLKAEIVLIAHGVILGKLRNCRKAHNLFVVSKQAQTFGVCVALESFSIDSTFPIFLLAQFPPVTAKLEEGSWVMADGPHLQIAARGDELFGGHVN